MSNSLHEAAKAGRLDPLHEATKRECNRGDETGMTPTLWAAYNGKIAALRLLVSRGGDPNKADLQGNTALHLAALCGHRTIIEYLIALGCNLWALNNEYRTAMQLAAENGKKEVLAVLDDVSSRQAATNRKVVQKAKEKAVKEADERVRKYDKLVKEHEKQMAKQAKKDERTKSSIARGPSGDSTYSDVLNQRYSKKGTVTSLSQVVSGSRKRGDGDGNSSTGIPASESGDTIEEEMDPNGVAPGQRDSRFWLPNRTADGLMSLPKNDDAADIDDALDELDKSIHDPTDVSPSADTSESAKSKDSGSRHSRTAKPGDSISTVFRGDKALWTDVEVDLDDDVDPANSAIELFLTVNDLEDYIGVFYDEDIDMKALELLTEQDILELGLPLGPRRKLNQAIATRKAAMSSPGVIQDSAL
ncbi:pre-mRNA splicing regulator USH1G-like [Diadema antillarum]|uniref:pre-mRNA splicing regulator USH1G-like n=1 Tax=Diadema antillarum TaxID=105358 RepID=UPI003A8C678D